MLKYFNMFRASLVSGSLVNSPYGVRKHYAQKHTQQIHQCISNDNDDHNNNNNNNYQHYNNYSRMHKHNTT